MSIRYRSEVDGLRAIAVASVVLFHAGLPGFSGGFAGVDVFFVLSGYLIGAILMADLAAGRFSLLRFYERRARRLLPALAVVIVATLVVGFALLNAQPMEDLAESVFATALFAANLYFLRNSDYFAADAEEKPLLHMWSLAVEEQFYLVFPLVLLALWRWRRDMIWPALIAASLLSLVLAEIGSRTYPMASFFLPLGRAWELLAGAMVAWALHDRRRADRPGLAGLGLGLIVLSVLLIGEDRPWPGFWTVPPVAGTVLVLLYCRSDRGVGRALAAPPLVGLGLISYSVYLWHWPLMAYARTLTPLDPPLVVMLGLAAVSVGLGWASWRFVEQPFRAGRAPLPALSAAATLLIALAATGLAIRSAPEAVGRVQHALISDEVLNRMAVIDESQSERGTDLYAPLGTCIFSAPTVTEEFTQRFEACRAQHGPAVLVLGGSHASDLYNALAGASGAEFLVALWQGGCRPHRSLVARASEKECHYYAARDFVAARSDDVGLVLYTQAGHTMFEAYREVNGSEDGFHPELIDSLIVYLNELSAHVPVLTIGPKPMSNIDVRELNPRQDIRAQVTQLYDHGTDRAIALVSDTMARKFSAAGQPFLSTRAALSNWDFPDAFLVGGRLTYADQDHWSVHGERIFGPAMVAALEKEGYGALVQFRPSRAFYASGTP